MKVTGVIAELNPLHNGHAYFLEKARELTGADILIVVLSGDFVQRGAPALLSKYARAKSALLCGADLVIELPVFCACASAEYFADGAIRMLHDLSADSFVFGSESGSLSGLLALSDLFVREPENYQALLKEELTRGKNFPAARKHAVSGLFPEYAALLDAPNNLLGIEYLKACQKQNAPLTAYTLARCGNPYHADTLSTSSFPSASALRKAFCTPDTPPAPLACFLPKASYDILCQAAEQNTFVTEADLSSLFALKLLQFQTANDLTLYADMNPELANRIFARRFEEIMLPDFILSLKTKELTYTRISRAIMHTLLGITRKEQEDFRNFSHTPYARILGMRKTAHPLLKRLKGGRLPLILQPARAKTQLSLPALHFFMKDIACSQLYRQISFAKSKKTSACEFTHEIIHIE